MLAIDHTLFFQLANFLILLFFLNIFLYKPIRGILAERNEKEQSLVNAIEDLDSNSEKNEKGVEEGRVQARKEGVTEKDGLKGLGREKETAILRTAASSAEGKIGDAKKDIEAKIAEVQKSLEGQVTAFSNELAEKILGRSV